VQKTKSKEQKSRQDGDDFSKGPRGRGGSIIQRIFSFICFRDVSWLFFKLFFPGSSLILLYPGSDASESNFYAFQELFLLSVKIKKVLSLRSRILAIKMRVFWGVQEKSCPANDF